MRKPGADSTFYKLECLKWKNSRLLAQAGVFGESRNCREPRKAAEAGGGYALAGLPLVIALEIVSRDAVGFLRLR